MVYYVNKKFKDGANSFNVRKSVFGGACDQAEKRLKITKIAVGLILAAIFVYIGFIAVKTSLTFDAISGSQGSILKSIVKMIPFNEYFFKTATAGKSSPLADASKIDRLNILLLGMRGEGDPNGGLLTDSMMLISIKPDIDQIALISIPRDIYVELPDYNIRGKINSAYEIGELRHYPGGGLAYSKKVINQITGLDIHYAVNVDFTAFKKIIDTLGGVTVTLDKPFEDPIPLEEGKISLPAGKSTLSGDKALLYARVRFSSSDFDRARRQQQIFLAIKEKALTSGVLLNPFKVGTILDILSAHIKTDMELWEAQKLAQITQNFRNAKIIHKVFDSGPEGELVESHIDDMFVLTPKTGNFNQIRDEAENIFKQPEINASKSNSQADLIKPK